MADLRKKLHADLDALLDHSGSTPESLQDVVNNVQTSLSEPLCETDNRYVLLPIKHQDLWALYKKAQSSYWVPEEIDLKNDLQDFNKMTENERTFIKNILAFFAASDFIVNENLMERFMKEIKTPEAQCFYALQTAIESIHSETYALLLDTLIRDPTEKHRALNAIQTIPCIAKKAAWAQKWTNDRESSLAKRIVCFAIVEGIHFSGSFCALYWLRTRNLMPGVTFSNNLIARDESLHTEFATVLYNKLENRLSDDEIHFIVREAVDVEKEFIIESIPCALIGMSSPKMAEYIEFVADRLLAQLGHPKLYGTKNPFGFMELVSMASKSSFFETRTSEYAKAFVGLESKEQEFGLDEDF